MNVQDVIVNVMTLPHGKDLPLPVRASEEAAGLDLHAAIPADMPLRLEPGARALVPTGIALALPTGYEAQIRSRSGLALHHGVAVLNAPGTIDADYRGEVKVILINHGAAPFEVRRGDRVAQMVVAPVSMVRLNPVAQLTNTARSDAGFGSTEIRARRGTTG